MTEHAGETSPRGLFLTLVALLALAAVSFGFRFVPLGGWGFAVALGIAAMKAVLVVVFFMEILTEKPTVAFAFVTGLVLFAVMMSFILADVVTRSVPPLTNPPGTAERVHG